MRAIEVIARPAGPGATETKLQPHPGLVLPIDGSLVLRASDRGERVATPNHVLLLSPDVCYRFRGDRCLVLDWPADALARLVPEAARHPSLTGARDVAQALLPAPLVLEGAALLRRLGRGDCDSLDVEETSLALLRGALAAAANDDASGDAARGRDRGRRRRQVRRVQEAIAADPTARWTVETLAGVAGLSPGRLAHVFRSEVGVPVHAYVVRTRLVLALERVLDDTADLAAIAVDAGFAHHSHFTARFRALFGVTPSALRGARRGRAARDHVARVATTVRTRAA